MKRFCFLLTAILLFTGLRATAQTDSVERYVTRALDIMKAKSVNKHTVNWDALYSNSRNQAKGVSDIALSYPIIQKALEALKDAHSEFYPPEAVKAYVLGYRATGQAFPVIEAHMTAEHLAYLKLPGFACYNFKEWNEFVNDFYRNIETLNALKPKGWILDLRENAGGMFYPMLAAIAPMLDTANAIGTVDAEGVYSFFNYSAGKLTEGETLAHKFTIKRMPKHITKPIVVMVSKKTASSGEFCAIAFAGQKNVTIIGQRTQGLTSGNQEYPLSDGAFIALTIGNTIDRSKKEYDQVGQGLTPQVVLQDKSDAAFMKTASDIVSGK